MILTKQFLKQNNPFSSDSVNLGRIWDPDFPDAPSINKDAFDQIVDLVKQKQNDPIQELAVLILGEAGTGKSQLVVRTAKYCSDGSAGCSLVSIPQIFGAEEMPHIIEHIFDQLFKEYNNRENSLFKRLLSAVLHDYFKEKLELEDEELDLKLTEFFAYSKEETGNVDHLSNEVIDWLNEEQDFTLDQEFLQILLQICNPSRQKAAISWLKGEPLNKTGVELLGLSLRSIDSENGETEKITPSQAQKRLRTFGKLLARDKQVLLICFDQVEHWTTPGNPDKLDKIVQTIFKNWQGMIPVLLSRPYKWKTEIESHFDEHLLYTLSHHTITLQTGCTEEQVKELIKEKIKYTCEKNGIQEWKDLCQQVTKNVLQNYTPTTPRKIVGAAKIVVETIADNGYKIRSRQDRLREKYDELTTNELPDSNSAELIKALNIFFSGIGIGDEIDHVYAKKKKNNIRTSRWLIITSNTSHPTSVISCLSEGISYLLDDENKNKPCIYIADSRENIPSGTTTNVKKEEFISLNGIPYRLDHKKLPQYYALSFLGNDILKEDIVDPENDTPLTIDDLYTFVKTDPKFEPLIDVESLHKEHTFHSILKGAPNKTLPIDDFIDKAKEKGVTVTNDILKEFCELHNENYGINETNIWLKLDWGKIGDEIEDFLKISYGLTTPDDVVKILNWPISVGELVEQLKNGELKDRFDFVNDISIMRK